MPTTAIRGTRKNAVTRGDESLTFAVRACQVPNCAEAPVVGNTCVNVCPLDVTFVVAVLPKATVSSGATHCSQMLLRSPATTFDTLAHTVSPSRKTVFGVVQSAANVLTVSSAAAGTAAPSAMMPTA